MAINISGNGNITGINSLNTDVSATELGYLDGISGIGKVLQIVRATDSTLRDTTSTSLIDVTGMSVTITPQKSTSSIIVLATAAIQNAAGTTPQFAITDSNNNGISGAESSPNSAQAGWWELTLLGYSTPATISAVTYKLRFATNSGTILRIRNDQKPGQMYAIEVAS